MAWSAKWLLLPLVIGLWACGHDRGRHVMPAFYHWKTRLPAGEVHRPVGTQRLYIRAFDIDWDAQRQEAVPLAVVEGCRQAGLSARDVPVVFITHRTFLSLDSQQIQQLAVRTIDRLQTLWPVWPPAELQFDCDWTPASREAYFAFLQHIRRLSGPSVVLSATIRLHQYRQPEQTGLPPVDRGMLMYYNMGEIRRWEEPNSILNHATGRQYLQADNAYPLPLDLALPLFSWAVVFRDGKLSRLITEADEASLETSPGFRPLGKKRYERTVAGYWKGYYLYQGDQLRLEQVTAPDLLTAAKDLRQAVNTDSFRLAFFHLDSTLIDRLGTELLQTLVKTLARPAGPKEML
jgi:hypothetical protein